MSAVFWIHFGTFALWLLYVIAVSSHLWLGSYIGCKFPPLTRKLYWLHPVLLVSIYSVLTFYNYLFPPPYLLMIAVSFPFLLVLVSFWKDLLIKMSLLWPWFSQKYNSSSRNCFIHKYLKYLLGIFQQLDHSEYKYSSVVFKLIQFISYLVLDLLWVKAVTSSS